MRTPITVTNLVYRSIVLVGWLVILFSNVVTHQGFFEVGVVIVLMGLTFANVEASRDQARSRSRHS